MDRETFRQMAMNFQAALNEMARVHMDAGEDEAAGMLLVAERRVYSAVTAYYVRVPYDGSAPEKVPPKRRGRPRKGEPEVQTEITEKGSADE